jgi:hypothetical protein
MLKLYMRTLGELGDILGRNLAETLLGGLYAVIEALGDLGASLGKVDRADTGL